MYTITFLLHASSIPDLEFALLHESIERAVKSTDNVAECRTTEGGIERGLWKQF